MTPERWHRIKELFESALERALDERPAFLDHACDGDESLRKEVESLLASFEDGESFMERPAIALAAETLAGSQGESLVGQTIGHYKVTRGIGSGGMGEVYLAQDTRLGRHVAVKLLPTLFTTDEDRLRRFAQEARAASALNHPNVCVIHEVGETEDERQYIAMEYIDGETLRQHMTKTRLKLSEVLDITIQVAAALAAAHSAGIVHRDIKPENIMLRRDGYVKVLDFGLAKLTETHASTLDPEAATRVPVKTGPGMVMGTVSYMSPEQARGLAVDGRTDLWSLGVVFYEMIAGRVPFEGVTPSDVMVSVLTAEPLPLTQHKNEVPVELEQVVTKALRKESKDRYQTAAELLADLKLLNKELELETQMGSARPDSHGQATATKRASGAVDTDKKLWTRTGAQETPRLTESISYLYRNVADHRQRALVALAAIIIAAGAIAFGLYEFRGRNSLAPKTTRFLPDMVAIPGGTFQMGRDDGNLQDSTAHTVTVSSFYIDRTAVTNADYATFVRETKYPSPMHWSGETPPAGQEKWQVTYVSKDDAEAFAAWRSRRDRVKYRLPSEEEWEYAARNGSLGTLYPWGNNTPQDLAGGSQEPVASHPSRASFRGVYDMIGNVSEWTSSTFSPYPGSNHKTSGNPEFRDWVVFRGGGNMQVFGNDGTVPNGQNVLRINSASRDFLPASYRSPVISFRLVRSGP